MKKYFFIHIVFILLFYSCSSENTDKKYISIGVRSDVETLNPLFAFQPNEGDIAELLFLALVQYQWDEKSGDLETYLMLAEQIEWENDSTSLLIKIKDDVYWSDGVKVSVDDIITSFDIYSDPIVQSRAMGFFHNYYHFPDGKIDIEKSFQKITDLELRIIFNPESKPSFYDIDLPLIPHHYFKDIKRENIANSNFNLQPITNGAYKLEKWDKDQAVTLVKNDKSFLIREESPEKLIFRVIPDYNNRFLQLKRGELDIVEEIKPEDAAEINNLSDVFIHLNKGREYDYIGWNIMDPTEYSKNEKYIPNKLFSNPNVRKALTYALNRKEVLNNFLYNFGELASGPISSIFLDSYDKDITPYDYNPKLALELLHQEGWQDLDKDGTLEKGDLKFKFNIAVPSGNPRRKFAATIFANNLKSIGVDVNFEFLEMNTFLDGLFNKKYDAWMVGWQTPIPINLKIQWYSDLKNTPLNFISYQNEIMDSLLLRYDQKIGYSEKKSILRKISQIIHSEEPYTFLYWIDNIVAVNKKVKNIRINPLGVVQACWNWSTE